MFKIHISKKYICNTCTILSISGLKIDNSNQFMRHLEQIFGHDAGVYIDISDKLIEANKNCSQRLFLIGISRICKKSIFCVPRELNFEIFLKRVLNLRE